MPTQYAKHVSRKTTPQSQPIPGTTQIENSAGGFVWAVDCWTRLNRFLILGCDGGTFYATEQKLTRENAAAVEQCIAADGKRTVARIVEVSDKGLAYKNDPAIFALALAASVGSVETKRAAFEAVPLVCRIGTHLFHFAAYCRELRGYGRGLKRTIGRWYTEQDINRLAMEIAKYRSRDGWSHRDLLRLSHVKVEDPQRNGLLRYAVKGEDGISVDVLPEIVGAAEAAKTVTPAEIVGLIAKHDLPMECIPTDKRTAEVYRALLPKSGLTWLIRNLGNLSKAGVLKDGAWKDNAIVVDRINDHDALRKSRIHPFQILAAMTTYSQGHGMRGMGYWLVCQDVVEALDRAFYLSFENVEPTGKRIMLAVDVSGSMDGTPVAGIPGLNCRQAAAAFAMVNYRVEKQCILKGFSAASRGFGGQWGGGTPGMEDIRISRNSRLDDACRVMKEIPMGGTDCALPMIWAAANKVEVDAFVVLTDSETWAGQVHPSQALVQYRKQTGIPARLAVVAFESNEFTIADPNDTGMLDIVGGSADTPNIVSDFVAGKL